MKKRNIIIAVCSAVSAVLGTIVFVIIHKHSNSNK